MKRTPKLWELVRAYALAVGRGNAKRAAKLERMIEKAKAAK